MNKASQQIDSLPPEQEAVGSNPTGRTRSPLESPLHSIPPSVDPAILHHNSTYSAHQLSTSGRKGDWIQTFTGIQFWPLDPRPEEIRIEDIAHSLSLQCRFGGHCEQFYSVAEHSVRVSLVVPPEDALWGLLHDAAEAYLVDLPRPIKRCCEMGRLYHEIEDTLILAVCEAFGLSPEQPDSVKRADVILLVTEKRDLMKMPPKPWEDTADPLPARIHPYSPQFAKKWFLTRFADVAAPVDSPGEFTLQFPLKKSSQTPSMLTEEVQPDPAP